jgi:hypothetical protein
MELADFSLRRSSIVPIHLSPELLAALEGQPESAVQLSAEFVELPTIGFGPTGQHQDRPGVGVLCGEPVNLIGR